MQSTEIIPQLSGDQPIRFPLEPDGWLQLDRKLPFLLIFRQPQNVSDLSALVKGESAYLLVPEHQKLPENLLKAIMEQRAGEYGSFLLIDICISERTSPTLAIQYNQPEALPTVEALEQELQQLPTLEEGWVLKREDNVAPLCVDHRWIDKTGSLCIRLEIPSVFLNVQSKPKRSVPKYPVLFREFRKTFSQALRRAIYRFIRVQTNYKITNPGMLGRSSVDEAFWKADQQLAAIEKSFDFLLLVSAINSEQAWKEFQDSRYRTLPTFYYRILPVDPEKLKHQLYTVELDDIHDPALSFLLRDKRKEIDKQLDMLQERGTEDFLYSSIRLYQGIDPELLQLAKTILREVHLPEESEEWIDLPTFTQRVQAEFAYFSAQDPTFHSEVRVQADVPGMMVSRGKLYLTPHYGVKPSRVEPIIQHEVGTHILTFHNGSHQSINLLRYGLADYDELQEGLAVLSEYLVGGLDAERLRLLAMRVITANCRLEGAAFADTYHVLIEEYQCLPEVAFETVTRIYQSGGFIKDIIYLRGFVKLLKYLQKGGNLLPLLVGKIAIKHIPVIQELLDRGILHPPALLPRYFNTPAAQQKLNALTQGFDITKLVG